MGIIEEKGGKIGWTREEGGGGGGRGGRNGE